MKLLLCIVGTLVALHGGVSLRAQAPTGSVRGRLVDDATQEPLAGVLITVGTRSALSQMDGRYLVTFVPAGTYTLRARMVGYAVASQFVTVVGDQEAVVDLGMTARAVGLSEIVVTGYGEQRVGDITGAVSEVTPDQFNPGTIVNALQLIASKVPGMQVVSGSNEPGDTISVVIRGQTSVNASSQPLYVIDGVPLGTGAGGGMSAGRDPLNFLNPDDIESITVLRDASAAAIYGANAANGVVVIQTKSARRGTQITYSSSVSASSITRHLQVLNAMQFDSMVRLYAPWNDGLLGTANTNWLSLVTRTALAQEHNLAISSAGQSSSYRLSLGYLRQDGVVKGTSTERISLGLNYDQRLFNDRLDIHAFLKGSRAFDRFSDPGSVLSSALNMAPTQPVRDSTSVTGYYEWPNSGLAPDNPVAILALRSDQGTTYRSVGSLQAEYRLPFLQGLKATLNLGYDLTKVDRESFAPSTMQSEITSGKGGEEYREDGNQGNVLIEGYLNYTAPLNAVPGTIDLTGGYSYAQSHADSNSIYLAGLSSNVLGDNGYPVATTVTPWTKVYESKLISLFGRVNYNLDDRYLVSVSVRRDGSSRFGPTHAWGVFPSVSFAWRISGEPFLSGLRSLSDLKLRASWGRTGNQAFADYLQRSSYTLSNSGAQYQFGGVPIPTIRPSAVDSNIRWEQTDSYDVGLDFGFLGQQVTGTIDWYTKRTKDLIFTVPIPAGANFSNQITTNIGRMRNQGIEFSLSARVLRGGRNALGWTADFTAAHNSNELVSIYAAASLTQQIVLPQTPQVLEPGQPINAFFVCRQYYQKGKPVENTFLSLVGDSIINNCYDSDRRPFHDPAPKWTLGHTSYLTYGNLDLSFSLRAWLGNYILNGNAGAGRLPLYFSPPQNVLSAALTNGFVLGVGSSDYGVQDGSFLRMENITVGYTFRYRGQPMRVFATVQNAFTITGYSGVDPAGVGLGGIDGVIYPLARTFTGGLSVRF